MPKANINVPRPSVPPNNQPKNTTVISIAVRTRATGRLVTRCKPVIRPSLGPGPRFAIKYRPLPKPTSNIPKVASATLKRKTSVCGRYGRDKSMAIAIITAFNIVPIPGACFSGIHSSNTARLVRKVVTPILQPLIWETPWDRTVHGLLPAAEAINSASPRPNTVSPAHRTQSVENRGRKFSALSELQDTMGMLFTANSFIVAYIYQKKNRQG